MMELIRNAWLFGWPEYTGNGKFAALLLAGVMFYWFGRKEIKEKYRTLGIYTTVMVICCVCPLTAGLLMAYQTRFYDYQWIWNMVPVTIGIALVGTLLWTELVKKYSGQKRQNWKCAGITAVLVAMVYLSGSMGNTVWQEEESADNRRKTEAVLASLGDETHGMILWAPQEIMEYARALDGNISLPYGRNMWDVSLNAYAYDTYGEREKDLYAWMCNAEKTGEGNAVIETEDASERWITGEDCMMLVQELAVTHVLLPGNLLPEVLEELEADLGIKAESLAGYYLFRL